MKKRTPTGLLLIDSFPGHMLDFSAFKNKNVEFLATNITSYLQPKDQGFYQTVKEWYKSYLRNYTILATLAGRCIAISDIMKNMDKKLVKVFWTISGLSNRNGTDLKQTDMEASWPLSYSWSYSCTRT